MKIAGVILLAAGLLLAAVAMASTVFNMFGAFQRIAASPGMPNPAELGDQLSDALGFTVVLMAFGILSVLTGGILLLVGLLRTPTPPAPAGGPPGERAA